LDRLNAQSPTSNLQLPISDSQSPTPNLQLPTLRNPQSPIPDPLESQIPDPKSPIPDPQAGGYTPGMKTAVSIPDEVFEKVERLARRAGRSRSEVFSAALKEYVARHAPDEVTETMDRVCEALGDQSDAFVAAAGRRVLENTEW
jgi:hypothetical protein